jgi:thiol-disulfide isomerase/thioredoxin
MGLPFSRLQHRRFRKEGRNMHKLAIALLLVSCASDDEAAAPPPILNPDQDGDGFTLAEEEAAGTNPNYEYSRPYAGNYNVGFCNTPPEPTGPTGEGVYTYSDGSQVTWPSLALGDVPFNMTFADQHGEEVDLYSFCGKHVMIVVSAGWCPGCRQFAEYAQGVQDTHREAGLQMVTLITNSNIQGQAPDQAFVQGWADQYGFSDIPVLALDLPYRDGTAEEFYDHPTFWFDKDAYTPSYYHLNERMEVISADDSVRDPSSLMD